MPFLSLMVFYIYSIFFVYLSCFLFFILHPFIPLSIIHSFLPTFISRSPLFSPFFSPSLFFLHYILCPFLYSPSSPSVTLPLSSFLFLPYYRIDAAIKSTSLSALDSDDSDDYWLTTSSFTNVNKLN